MKIGPSEFLLEFHLHTLDLANQGNDVTFIALAILWTNLELFFLFSNFILFTLQLL